MSIESLTERQKDCLSLVLQGLSSKEIAQRLNLSPHTVDTYIAKAAASMGVNNRYDASRIFKQLTETASSPDFISEPEPLVFDPKSAEPKPSTETRSSPLIIPPLGGSRQGMSVRARLQMIVQLALLFGVALAALVLAAYWILALFS